MQDYTIQPQNVKGVDLPDADCISRLESDLLECNSIGDVLITLIGNNTVEEMNKLRLAHTEDKLCQLIERVMKGEIDSTHSSLTKPQQRMLDNKQFVHDHHNIIHVLWQPDTHVRSGTPSTLRLVAPASYRDRLVAASHGGHCITGHQGITRTYEHLCEVAWWPNMIASCTRHVTECESCQAYTATTVNRASYPIEYPTGPWEMVGVDSIDLGPNKCTERGNRYIVVMMDYLSNVYSHDGYTTMMMNGTSCYHMLSSATTRPIIAHSKHHPSTLNTVDNLVYLLT